MMWTDKQAFALASIFESLNQSGIKWLVLRNYEGLPNKNRSKDIDLALSKLDIPKAKEILKDVLAKHGFTRVFNVSYQYADCNIYFSSLNEQIYSLKIDLLDGFVWRGAYVSEFEDIYSRRVKYSNFYVPHQFDDSFMLWIKPLLTGGIIKSKYVDDIQTAFDRHPSLLNKTVEKKFGKNLAKKVCNIFRERRMEETIELKMKLRFALWLRSFRYRPINLSIAAAHHVFNELVRRSRRQPASMISVAGPDGVGKTTFIMLLRQELSKILVKDLDDIIVSHFRPNLLPNIKKLLSNRSYDPSTEQFNNPHRADPASIISSFLRLMYYWLDYVLGYLVEIRRMCATGNNFIFDRYFYDFVVDPRRSRIKLPLWVRMGFLQVTPQPDLVFFLDCDADIIFSRKQELSREEIERQLGMYRRLTENFPQRFIRLDARKAPEVLCQQALKQIIERSFPLL